jgi:hypothetical protein
MKTNKMLAAVLALQGLLLIGQWTGHGNLTAAQAQIPDPANRQMQMVDELKSVNDKLDTLIGMLKDGNLQVKVANPDDNKSSKSSDKPHGK